MSSKSNKVKDDLTLDDIKEMCEYIPSQRSKNNQLKRLLQRPPNCSPPLVSGDAYWRGDYKALADLSTNN